MENLAFWNLGQAIAIEAYYQEHFFFAYNSLVSDETLRWYAVGILIRYADLARNAA